MEYYSSKTGRVYQGKSSEIEEQIQRDIDLSEKGTQVLRKLERKNEKG